MVGAPGSGKSTYAARIAKRENAVIISGDQIRAELYGDANIQGEWMAPIIGQNTARTQLLCSRVMGTLTLEPS